MDLLNVIDFRFVVGVFVIAALCFGDVCDLLGSFAVLSLFLLDSAIVVVSVGVALALGFRGTEFRVFLPTLVGGVTSDVPERTLGSF